MLGALDGSCSKIEDSLQWKFSNWDKYFPYYVSYDESALLQEMAWRPVDAKPFLEAMLIKTYVAWMQL